MSAPSTADDLQAIEAMLRAVAAGDPLECAGCERELVPGDAVVADPGVVGEPLLKKADA